MREDEDQMSPRAGIDKQVILRTAAEMADQYGFEEVTIARLARALNIRPPSLYNHIEGLNELRRELSIYSVQMLYDHLMHAVNGRSKEEAIEALCLAYLDFARRHPGLYEAAQLAPSPEEEEWIRLSYQVVELIMTILEPYGLQGDEAVHHVRILRSLLHGFASLEQKNGFGLPLNLEETQRRMIAVLIAGIQSPAEYR